MKGGMIVRLFTLLMCVWVCKGQYKLQSNFSGATFFNGWDFYTQNDPTHGYVNYVSQAQAQQEGLIKINGHQVTIASDSKNVASGRGRNSVRISTSASYNAGLFIADLENMPTGCGTWPAWWLVGPGWPTGGEIDIIEGVNVNTEDATTLHTDNGCTMDSSTANFTGTWSLGTNGKPATNCYINAPNQNNNQGCGIIAGANTYGAGFNQMKGGVFAVEWTKTHISSYFFPRNNIPKDIQAGLPTPNTWGKPYAYFGLGSQCNPSHFSNMQMVIDLTFCGDWAGAVFGSNCPGKGSCNSYVQNNPSAFADAYWLFNYIKVFQE